MEHENIFGNVVIGLPKVAELIADIPESRRSVALDAAAQSYLNTARELGYAEEDAQQWAAAVMERLHDELDRCAIQQNYQPA